MRAPLLAGTLPLLYGSVPGLSPYSRLTLDKDGTFLMSIMGGEVRYAQYVGTGSCLLGHFGWFSEAYQTW